MATTNGTVLAPLTFETWSEAFDCCRERNMPIVAEVEGEVCKCFPSGHGEVIRPGPRIRRPQEDCDPFDTACERRYDE